VREHLAALVGEYQVPARGPVDPLPPT